MARVLKPAAVRAGLGEWVKAKRGVRPETWVGFHSFQHTCGTMLFRDGWNAKQVCMFLGHTDPGFTLRTYIHLLNDDLPEPQVLASAGGNKGATGATETDRSAVDAIPLLSRETRDAPRLTEAVRRTRNEGVPGSSPGVGARKGVGNSAFSLILVLALAPT